MDQPALFPIADLQTKGYAQPEPRPDEDAIDEIVTDAPRAEAA